MKTIIFRLLFFVSLSSLASTPFVQRKHTETKKESKTFTVNELSSLFVSNKYGTITLIADDNNKNTIKIDATIKVSSDALSDAQERIKNISVSFLQNEQSVSAKTLIKSSNTSFFKNFWKSSSSVSMRIDYVVSLPTKTKISLENEYGDIFLNKTDNSLKIKSLYGSINIEQVNADASLHLEYSNNSSIKYVKNLYLTGDYNGISVEKANYIKTTTDYTSLKINVVEKLEASCEYGALSANVVENLSVDGEYTAIKIGKIGKQGKISSEYGNVQIQEVSSSVNLLNIKGEYSTISVKYHKNWDFSYEFSNSSSKTKVPDNLPYSKKNIGNMESYISGTKGKGENVFKINSEFGEAKVEEF